MDSGGVLQRLRDARRLVGGEAGVILQWLVRTVLALREECVTRDVLLGRITLARLGNLSELGIEVLQLSQTETVNPEEYCKRDTSNY